MISLTVSELFSLLFLVSIAYLSILAWRFQSRRGSHDWRLSSSHLFHCDKCHNSFVPKEPVNLSRCPRCNAICFRKKELCMLGIAVFLGAFSGCALLPPGEPPVGEIVRNRVSQTLTKPEIIQNLASLLIAASLQDFPRAPVMLEGSDKELLALGKAAILEASGVCGIRCADMAAAILKCEHLNSGAMRFTLYHFSMEKWQRTFYLKGEQP